MTLAIVAKNALSSIQHKSPVILTGLGVAGLVSTVIFAVRAGVETGERMRADSDASDEYEHKPTPKELVKTYWPLYVPVVVLGLTSIGCIIGAQSVNSRRQAALVGAFTLTEGAFQEYKEQVVEALGIQKEQKVRDDNIQKKVTENPPSELVVIGSGNVLCMDDYTGRYFESTMEKIRGAQNDFNSMLLNGEMYASLNEFYQLVGLEPVFVGEQVGFATENLLDINFSTAMTSDGRPCLALSFRALPKQDYHRFQ